MFITATLSHITKLSTLEVKQKITDKLKMQKHDVQHAETISFHVAVNLARQYFQPRSYMQITQSDTEHGAVLQALQSRLAVGTLTEQHAQNK